MKGVGKIFRDARDLVGIPSDAEVARRVEISPKRYSNYIKDDREPDFETLLKICDVLKITPNQVFSIDPLPNDPLAETNNGLTYSPHFYFNGAAFKRFRRLIIRAYKNEKLPLGGHELFVEAIDLLHPLEEQYGSEGLNDIAPETWDHLIDAHILGLKKRLRNSHDTESLKRA